jgi:hypothetical protein
MPELFTSAFGDGPAVPPLEVLLRLLMALGLGGVVALVYRFTRRTDGGPAFPTTLVLLCVLIAMVTQVIGDNVARAFSLVGALSIVRFRTVVRDTQDTAYVIFAVTVGMAVGAKSLWVAVIGIGVIALAEAILMVRAGRAEKEPSEFLIRVRVGVDYDVSKIADRMLKDRVVEWKLMSMGTGKLGAYFEGCYLIRVRSDGSMPELMKALTATEGVQSVQVERRGSEGE